MPLEESNFSKKNAITLIDTLLNHKNSETEIVYCNDVDSEEILSYADLYHNALELLGYLTSKGLGKGDQLIFQLESNLNFTTTFWACILGGIIPVPVSVGVKDDNFKKVFSVWAILDDPFLCVDSQELFDNLKSYSKRFGLQNEFEQICRKSLNLTTPHSGGDKDLSKLVCDVRPDDIAFIQFSSGSTGQPKGVVLTHKNLVANVKALANCSEATNKDVMVSWMPLTHDMGLIAVHLTSTLLGIKQVLIDTPVFVRRPFIWMEKTSVHKGTMLFTPNYGLHITLISMERRKFDWDLSNVRVIFNGAEPISLTLADQFLKALAPYKLPYHSMYPVYGLAEASVGVSLPKPGAPMKPHYLDRTRLNFGQKITNLSPEDPNAITFLEVGTAIDECSVKIADEKGKDILDSHIGLIHIKGNNVTSGYFKNQEETERVLHRDGWLNTGDLGFIQDGQLIITGRAKDLIIINGQNIYAHDIEQICTQVPELLLRNVVASSVSTNNGSEELLLFIRYKKSSSDFIKLSGELRKLLHAKMGLRVHAVIPLTTIPKTTSGKVRRYKLKERYLNGEFKAKLDEIANIHSEQKEQKNTEKTREHIHRKLHQLLFTLLGYHIENSIDKLSDHGIDSIKAVEFRAALENKFSIDIPVSCIFDYPTVAQLEDYLFTQLNAPNVSTESENIKDNHSDNHAIAIIGLAGQLPGGQTSNDAFFTNLLESTDLSAQIPEERWSKDIYFDPENRPGTIKTKRGYFLEKVNEFDAAFFGITPVEAETMDPQQRMLLTVTQHAIDNAGIKNESLNGSKTAVYIGMANSDFSHQVFEEKHSDLLKEHSLTGTITSTAAGRLSYCYGLTGPSLTLDTACSSSLVALDLARTSLLTGKADQALVGGVNLILSPQGYISLSRVNALSEDGKCKVFDESANGYGRGEGCAVLVLKRLSDAQRDGDTIRAIIIGSSVNHDGKSSGLTVPNGQAQESVIKDAMAQAGVSIDDIAYVEAHGTGTKLGDPQELNALANIFKNRDTNNPLPVGSIKSNIGHLEGAAGIAGVIKLVLAMEQGIIPKNLHLDKPNTLVPWNNIPLKPVREPVILDNTKVINCGISSFGLSGTNVHLVLQNQPRIKPLANKENIANTLIITAKTQSSLNRCKEQYLELLSQSRYSALDITTASQRSYQDYSYRIAVVGSDNDSLISKLKQYPRDNIFIKPQGSIAFIFTGQGSQYFGMAKGLYQQFIVFNKAFKECSELFLPYLKISLEELLYQSESDDINNTLYSQPIIFSIGYALLKLLREFGVEPNYLLGHSIGQYTAAFAAGILSLPDAVHLVANRARLMSKVKIEGAMVAVIAPITDIEAIIEKYNINVAIAAINSPDNITLSGSVEAIQIIIDTLEKLKIPFRKLKVSNAFHSPLMESVLDQFSKIIDEVSLHPPKLPIVSDLTGALSPLNEDSDLTSKDYWLSHITHSIMFNDALKTLSENKCHTFVEIGGSATLSAFVAKVFGSNRDWTTIAPLRGKARCSIETFNQALADLYTNQYPVNWKAMGPLWSKRVLDLPYYCFEKTTFPIHVGNSKINTREQLNLHRDISHEKKSTAPEADISISLSSLIEKISGLKLDKNMQRLDFLALGMDSLMLSQLKNKVNEKFGIDIPLMELYGQYSSVEKLQAYLHSQGAFQQQSETQQKVGSINSINTDENISELLTQQLRTVQAVCQAQLDYLNNEQTSDKPKLVANDSISRVDFPKTNFRLAKFSEDNLSSQQQKFINKLIKEFNEKTVKSKAFSQENKDDFAHYLTSLNFRKTLKEILYPLVSCNADGAYLWDIDNNRYIDLAIGYGVHFFGHKPEFVVNAVKQQMDKGFVLSPHPSMLGEVTQLIKEITNTERVSYCNTGSEAVMLSLRMARTQTGRNKIVKFSGSYHGIYDGILAESDEQGSYPTTPGITLESVQDTIVLPYGDPKSLNVIEELGTELAAVLVEPVQSRNPELQPREFLQKLRSLTTKSGAVLIFDEIITGFRLQAGGAQAFFDIQADLVTYGKVIGGGLPIGIIAGKRRFMDVIDGGQWRYQDGSTPQTEATFIAGTFSNHPMALAAAKSVLLEIKQKGSQLYEQTNELTFSLVERLNEYFTLNHVPIKVKSCGSIFRFESFGPYALALQPIEMDLVFYLMMLKGVYTWERRICFISTKHTQTDIDQIYDIVCECISELRAGGFSFTTIDSPLPPKGTPRNTDTPNRSLMSSAQKRIFALNSLKGAEQAYHLSYEAEVNGSIDPSKVQRVLTLLSRRHESLRTTFKLENGEFKRIVHRELSPCLELENATKQSLLQAKGGFFRPYDLENDPMLRAKLITLAEDKHIFLLDMHHIAADGFSANILFQEFVTLYKSQNENELSYPNQFEEFIQWEVDYFKSDKYLQDEEYWIDKFAGYLKTPQLPTDYPRPTRQTFTGNTHKFFLSVEKTKQLTMLAKKLNVSLYMLLLSGYHLLISKLTKNNEIFIGTPVALREQKGFESIVGMMTNTLVYRSNLENVKTFSELVHNTKENCINAYAHQGYPFEKLVEQYVGSSLQNGRDKSRNPLFDVNFVFEKADERVLRIPGLEFTPQTIEQKGNIYDFSFEAILQQQQLEINFHYNKNLFDLDTIINWKDLFLVIINNILQSSDVKLDTILPPEKINIKNSNDKSHPDWADANNILDRFNHIVTNYPNNTAVQYRQQNISYSQLDVESNQLAHMLKEQYGILPGERIAVQIDSGRLLISTLIAVLKLGCCYIPIDPGTPQDRANFILKDSLAKVLLRESHLPKLDFYSHCDLDRIDYSAFSQSSMEICPNPDDLAYIIYTSGSTGRPKGVKVLHSSLTNYFLWFIKKYQICNGDSSLLLSSYAFDLGYTSLWGCILSGACLHLMKKNDRQNIGFVLNYLARWEITFVKMTPSLFQMLVNHQDFGNSLDLTLRLIVLGGEKVRVDDIAIYLEYFKDTVFVNHYGPTEATIGCITREFNIDTFDRYRSLKSIGQPIANCKVYILDENLSKASEGEQGELCIEGDCLAQGYINNIDLEQEKFVPSPFSPGKRLYKTGDLAHVIDDEIYISDRIDDQVKVRGYRVELGEIIKVLEEHPNLKRAAVITKETKTGTELIAYCQGISSLMESDVRNFISRRLPDYMWPSHYFEVSEFPINANGKLDIKRLPDLAKKIVSKTNNFSQSLSESQQIIVDIWQKQLDVPVVGLNDDFFALGGHSLKAMLIAAELSNRFSIQLSINEIFDYPTVAKLDLWLSKNDQVQPEITPIKTQDLYPLSSAQKRLWLVSQTKEQSVAYNVHAAFLLEGELCIVSFEKALSELISRHDSLRTNFVFSQGEPKQKIHPDIDLPLTVLKPQRITFNSREFKQIYQEISEYHFDLENDPLFHVTLVRMTGKNPARVLIFNAHHIICDGWSNHILIKELCYLYNCYRRNEAADLEPLAIQYKDYAVWHNKALESFQAKEDKIFWENQLEGVSKPTLLPNAGANSQYNGSWHRTIIDKNISVAIAEYCQTNGVSLYTFMSCITGILLSYYCGNDEVIYSSPVATRQLPQLQDQVGFYLNNFLLRQYIEPNLRFIGFLNKTKSQLRNIMQHQLYPVEQVLEESDLKEGTISDFYRIILNVMEYESYSSYQMDGLIFRETLETATTSRADLNIMLLKGEILELVIEYNSQLMDEKSITSFKQQLIFLISQVLEKSEITLSELKTLLISSEEKQAQADFLDAVMSIDEEF
ncbi:amino acid adenylation domain-containing protein [Microbulbifer epialgicus]|uniref:Amino acid adenylation domain-containing protein n=1 Tax=Microbulbifer epialgicus TaxID=393907 RepID=A0ABV4P4J1_9GAMM